jgi:hypothetical protein
MMRGGSSSAAAVVAVLFLSIAALDHGAAAFAPLRLVGMVGGKNNRKKRQSWAARPRFVAIESTLRTSFSADATA